MKKQRYRWWRYIRRIIRDFPTLCAEAGELRDQSITASLSGMPRGGGAGRTVEALALRQLSPDDQKDYDAVVRAIRMTRLRPDGEQRIDMIRYMYWREKEHTVKDAAPRFNISEATAKRWHGDFVKQVAACRGFCVIDTPVPK